MVSISDGDNSAIIVSGYLGCSKVQHGQGTGGLGLASHGLEAGLVSSSLYVLYFPISCRKLVVGVAGYVEPSRSEVLEAASLAATLNQ